MNITAILLLAAPFVVSTLTALIKKVPVLTNLTDGPYTWIVRLIAFVLSLLGVVGAYMTTGNLDVDALSVLTMTALTFLGSTGVHFLVKPK